MQHKLKIIDGFTSKYNLTKLVYFEELTYVKVAIAAEKKLKGWTRKKKNNLVESENPEWEDLLPRFIELTATRGLGKDPSLHSG